MIDLIRFSYQRFNEDGELTVGFESKPCSAYGGMWVFNKGLWEAGQRFLQYPLPVDKPVDLSNVGLVHEKNYIQLSAIPLNGMGGIALRVSIAQPFITDGRVGFRYQASMEFSANYEHLTRLGTGLKALSKGDINEFELRLIT
ncbi:hypothetical protein [Asticcacaulis benevestitus]|uniref:Uncharacterized protein n=1 Tax=Asticcacaulis benevestitus DSM 16100 = ATCC BAA-896 TaxID=1121022 RepID=V4Q718_9CAUL|nr:hypothetical protein [Asticcacaulis benevestitus]ESQ93615.1 hypothetical protein ABENE_04685 [Asticcacaulis benevestitus DSM 16100 = ATCC BAA-896]